MEWKDGSRIKQLPDGRYSQYAGHDRVEEKGWPDGNMGSYCGRARESVGPEDADLV